MSRQTCKVCGRPDKFNFWVPDEVWAAVVPPAFQRRVVCLYCFDAFAVRYTKPLAELLSPIYFAGDRVTLRLVVASALDR